MRAEVSEGTNIWRSGDCDRGGRLACKSEEGTRRLIGGKLEIYVYVSSELIWEGAPARVCE